MKFKIVTIVLMLVGISYAQTIDNVLTKVEEKYKTQGDFKVSMQYQLFKGANGKDVIEEYKGLMIKKDKNLYTKINNTEMVNTQNFYLKVNHDEKAMLYDLTTKQEGLEQQINVKLLFKLFEKGKLRDTKDTWECELNAKMFSQMPYSRVILVVNKSDYSISKQIFYYSSLVDFAKPGQPSDNNIARLEINYNNFLKVSSLDDPYFKRNNYVRILNKKVVPVGKYKSYDIINATTL